jgi:histidinol phosphatase-like enzyme (inositol monophosphatase family)
MDDSAFAASCVALLHELADASAAIALEHFRTAVTVDQKADASPVTIADRDAEAAMIETIRRRFPDHGILGEEHGRHQESAEWLWLLDPIDGTQSFINGVPLFGTLIGLWHRDASGTAQPFLGCINHPALKERWLGGGDHPTTLNGRPVHVRTCASLSAAALYTTGPTYFSANQLVAYERLGRAVKRRRFGGTDCYGYAMVASGWIDLVCEASLKAHDYAALVPVIEAAGGHISDWNGAALTLESETAARGEVLAAGDARAHAAAIAVLQAK